jgi:hypothetical protein
METVYLEIMNHKSIYYEVYSILSKPKEGKNDRPEVGLQTIKI